MKNYMHEKLRAHVGHNVVCAAYGDLDNPADICIECEDCCEALVSAENFNEEEENCMINITLKDKQTGYDAVAEYIHRYWDHNIVEDVIVSIGTSYDGIDYCLSKEVASPLDFDDVEFLSDWWEGERYIKIFGIKTISEIDISGGLYEDEV